MDAFLAVDSTVERISFVVEDEGNLVKALFDLVPDDHLGHGSWSRRDRSCLPAEPHLNLIYQYFRSKSSP